MIWDPSMSDGCSVPTWVQGYSPYIAVVCKNANHCCVEHDRAYAAGGTESQRLVADFELFQCMRLCPRITDGTAVMFFDWVRIYGRAHFGSRPWHGGGPKSTRPEPEREGP
jgi:hypothetical protein